jgi:hypothetical protein
MMTGRIVTRCTAVLFASALAALPAVAQDAGGKKKGGKKGGEIVDVASLPAEVTDAVKKGLPDCKIESGTKKTGKKGDAYTLTLSKDGKSYEADLAPGKNGLQGEIVEPSEASALPKRASKNADTEAAGGKITKVEKLTTIPDGETQYRLTIDADGTSRTVTLSEKGKVIPAPGEKKKKKKDDGVGAGAAPAAGDAGTEKKDGAAAPPPPEKKE